MPESLNCTGSDSSSYDGLWKTLSFSKAPHYVESMAKSSYLCEWLWDGTKIQVVDNWVPQGKKHLFLHLLESQRLTRSKLIRKNFPQLRACCFSASCWKGGLCQQKRSVINFLQKFTQFYTIFTLKLSCYNWSSLKFFSEFNLSDATFQEESK